MNRIIKFRGKTDKNDLLFPNPKWVYGYLTIAKLHSLHKIHYQLEDCTWVNATVIPDTVGQFTGLHDKNGKEIYEGDIIESPCNIRHQILFSEERGYLCQYGVEFISWMDGYYEGGAITQSYINEFGKVVIGNIHDNPDLLTTK